MKTYSLAIFCWFILFSFSTQSQSLIDETVFGTPSMVNDLFAFEDGSRIIIENNLGECTLYNLKYLDNSGILSNYRKGQFREKPGSYLWSSDSLEIISVTDGHDVPYISSILRTVYYENSSLATREDTIYSFGDDQFINGFIDGQWTNYDGKSILMLMESGELYWNEINQAYSLEPIYDFDRSIVVDHLSFGYGNDESELLVNFIEDDWLYCLKYKAASEVIIDSIALENIVDIDIVDDKLIVISSDIIRIFSRELDELTNFPVTSEVEFINVFDNKVYYKLLDTEALSDHSRVSIDIAVLDASTMDWIDTLSIMEGPQVLHKVMLMDTIVHILGSYIENNQAVIQRHTITQTGAVEAPVSDLEVVGYSIVSSNYTQWQSNPASASAVLNVTLKKSDLKPNDNVLHLAERSGQGWCRPYIMDIFQDITSDDEFFDISISLGTSVFREQGDSLVARFNCSLFLPHGSPMNQNLDKNYLCPEVKFPKTVVSTERIEAKKVFDVFPNPVSDVLFLEFKSQIQSDAINYQIYNGLGTIVDSGTISVDHKFIDTHALAPGMYTLYMFDVSRRGSRNFIKQ